MFVYESGEGGELFVLSPVRNAVQFVVKRTDDIFYFAFPSKDSCKHIFGIILRRFFVLRIVAFQLELFSFQIIARVVFVTDGER